MDKRIGPGFYQSCENRESVGHVSVFGLRWCVWCRWGVGRAWARVWRVGGVMPV